MTMLETLQKQKAEALAEIAKNVAAAQAMCPHNHIVHDDGHRTYGVYHPERICIECGYREVGGWWCYSVDCRHWHVKDGDNTVLGPKPGRIIEGVSEDEFRKFIL